MARGWRGTSTSSRSADQRPVQFGLRFSANAAEPSRASDEVNTGAAMGFWRSNISAWLQSADSLTVVRPPELGDSTSNYTGVTLIRAADSTASSDSESSSSQASTSDSSQQ